MNKMKTQKGITLIALIITIVVLLILAVVAIGAAQESNIVDYAQNAAEGYETEKGKENKTLKDAEDLLSQYANGGNGGNLDAAALLAKFTENPEAFKHPDQPTTNGDRAIGTDGTAVNMDLWQYTKDDVKKEIALTGQAGSLEGASYSGNIKNGSIEGSMPQYIKPEGSNDIYTVTSMRYTFSDCENLKVAPTIPSGVTNMNSTFSNCTNLEIAPTIPDSVTNMEQTFLNCTNLTTAPTIPNGVTVMTYAFAYCTSLTTAPTIPSSVTDIDRVFYDCSSLTGTIRIESTNIESSDNYIINANNINKIQVPAGSVTETTIRALYSSNPNITIETFEVEE